MGYFKRSLKKMFTMGELREHRFPGAYAVRALNGYLRLVACEGPPLTRLGVGDDGKVGRVAHVMRFILKCPPPPP